LISLIPLCILILLLLLGTPIAFALAGSGLAGIWLITGDINGVLGVLGTSMFSTVASFTLTTIPMFILMAYFSSSSGLGEDLYNAGAKLLSSVRGGLGIATVFACGIFGALSGSSVAASTVMAKIAMPNMRRFGYSESLASGTIAVGAVLDILIPPSVGMVIYGMMTETSIGKLLIAGIVPGIVLAIFLALVIVVWVTLRPADAPKTERATWGERMRSLGRIWPSLLIIVLVFGLLYSGIVTPTEVGAAGALLSAIIGFAMGRLTWAGALDACMATVRTTAMIFVILIGGMLFGHFMVLSRIPQQIIAAVGDMNLNRWLIIAGIVVCYFVISMFMDELPLIIITIQVTFPLIVSLKFDPIWYGVMTSMMVAMGLVFPPVGMSAFIVSATAKVDLVKVYKGTSVLIIAIIITTVLLCFFPWLATWLPGKMR
jgi:C4-dicarboxylate transporter, DctM subunit